MEGEPQAWLIIVHVSIAFLSCALIGSSFVIGDRAWYSFRVSKRCLDFSRGGRVSPEVLLKDHSSRALKGSPISLGGKVFCWGVVRRKEEALGQESCGSSTGEFGQLCAFVFPHVLFASFVLSRDTARVFSS